jgi:hypothetical protein
MTLGVWGRVYFGGTQTLDGTGTVVLGNYPGSATGLIARPLVK